MARLVAGLVPPDGFVFDVVVEPSLLCEDSGTVGGLLPCLLPVAVVVVVVVVVVDDAGWGIGKLGRVFPTNILKSAGEKSSSSSKSPTLCALSGVRSMDANSSESGEAPVASLRLLTRP